MSVLFKWLRTGLLAFILTVPAAAVSAAPDFMPVDQVKAGMHGIAKTVISGTKIEEFGVEVLGVLKNKGPAGDLVLIRTYGDLIEKTGGIVQGMSGSPVYIDGKLVGAVAYGWSLTDHKIGMITPISDMLKLWELPDRHNPKAGSLFTASLGPDIRPVATPIMAAGFGERALGMLKQKLEPYNLIPYAVGDVSGESGKNSLEPGSAVGLQLVRGDVNLSALGTVTYTENDKVLAFGHPFLKKGNIGYFMTDAYVHTVIKGLENGFKIGSTGEAVGVVSQDRGAGIGGQVGRFPYVVPIRAYVKDTSLGTSYEGSAQIIHDEQLSPLLAAVTVYNFIDKTIDRAGPGTARVSFEILAKDMPGEILKRENMFYSPGNIGEYAISEIFEAMAILSGNQFHTVDILDLKVNVTVSEDRSTAAIMEARTNVASAKPGDKVDIAVKLKPFRGQPIVRKVSFVIPKGQKPGPLTLIVRGGGMVPLSQLLLKRQSEESFLRLEKKKQRTFDEVINDFASRDRNNDIVVEVMELDLSAVTNDKQEKRTERATIESEPKPRPRPEPARKQPANAKLSGSKVSKTKSESKPRNFVTTDYIIEGDTQVLIQVTN